MPHYVLIIRKIKIWVKLARPYRLNKEDSVEWTHHTIMMHIMCIFDDIHSVGDTLYTFVVTVEPSNMDTTGATHPGTQ